MVNGVLWSTDVLLACAEEWAAVPRAVGPPTGLPCARASAARAHRRAVRGSARLAAGARHVADRAAGPVSQGVAAADARRAPEAWRNQPVCAARASAALPARQRASDDC
eukprot:6333936-Prymnesium_polylepis.1